MWDLNLPGSKHCGYLLKTIYTAYVYPEQNLSLYIWEGEVSGSSAVHFIWIRIWSQLCKHGVRPPMNVRKHIIIKLPQSSAIKISPISPVYNTLTVITFCHHYAELHKCKKSKEGFASFGTLPFKCSSVCC